MNRKTLKLIIFNLFFVSVILPLYLTCKFATEWLWLYVPILSFWASVHLAENEKSQEDQNV